MAPDKTDLRHMRIEENYDLTRHNTFGITAKCKRFIEYATEEEAVETAQYLRDHPSPLLIIGGGSNLLLTGDFDGTVVHAAVKGIEVGDVDDEHVAVECGAGECWDDVVAWAVEQGYYGAENLSLIPGEVGASVVQNIGAYGVEVKDLVVMIEAVEIETGEEVIFGLVDCQYGYRQSRFKQEWKDKYLITRVIYLFNKQFDPVLDYGNVRQELERRGITEPTAAELRQTIIDIRREKLPDPEVVGNAGSFFMNPVVEREVYDRLAEQYPGMPHYDVDEEHVKIPAGWMIDQCGWKGKSLGKAGVHDRQALVLVNRGGATGQDVIALCQAVCADVEQKFGIALHPEVNIV